MIKWKKSGALKLAIEKAITRYAGVVAFVAVVANVAIVMIDAKRYYVSMRRAHKNSASAHTAHPLHPCPYRRDLENRSSVEFQAKFGHVV